MNRRPPGRSAASTPGLPVGPGLSRPTEVGLGAGCAQTQEPSRLKPLLQPPLRTPAGQRGMTLVELVISIVIIGIAAAALFGAMATITARSADPMLRQQSLAIAEGYLERLNLMPYDALGEIASEQPRGLDGEPLAELAAYRVAVRIEEAQLGPAGSQVPARHIRVTVTDPAQGTLTLDGWRTDY